MDPVPLSKIGTHLLASLGSKEKIGTLLLASEMPVPIPRSRTVTGVAVPLQRSSKGGGGGYSELYTRRE